VLAGKNIAIHSQQELREVLKKDRKVKIVKYVPQEFWIAKLSGSGTIVLENCEDIKNGKTQ
jgi:hypothetical protein